jgi:TolA-binding protein
MNLLTKIGLWGLLAGATAQALHADPVGGWLSPNGQAGASGGVGATATVSSNGVLSNGASSNGAASGSAGATVVLSFPDIQMRVHQLHEQTRADARHIQHLQQIARKEKDIIKLNCVNDKLVQVKPQMNIADQGESDLEGAKDTNRMAIFETIAQAAENVRRLREEADQCIGEPITQGSESSNSFTGPKSPDDPGKGFENPIEPPGYASPFN